MSLQEYKRKRKFDKTPEPKGEKQKRVGALRFVIQKHEASRLHYDFRLEMDGVLKSWAIPKGPSLNPDDRHLAVMVEDHPLEYEQFEGIIPKGNYGGGTVMVWDKGVYSPIALVDREKAQKILKEQLKKGHLTFFLLGEKLKGEFALIKTKGSDENAWLLIKAQDEYSTKKDVLKKDTSVLTKRTMEQIAKQASVKNEIWLSKPSNLDLRDIPKGKMPSLTSPMLAQSIEKPFDDNEWLFELKYDGYRAITKIRKGTVSISSRNHISFNEKFAPIVASLKRFPADVVFDGEVIVVDDHGHSKFQWLQDYPKSKKGELLYVIFDMLYYDGHILTSLPLIKRKELLKKILPPLPHIQYAQHIDTSGIAMFQQAQQLGIEGIVAKRKESHYIQKRSDAWRKIKTHHRQEVIICGFTQPKGKRDHFGSLIMGVYIKKRLMYVGHVGGGFTQQKLETIVKKLKPYIQKTCPFKIKPETNAPVTWVKPLLLAEVSFSQWTDAGQMRHPIFLGLREDKYAKEVEKEEHFSPDPISKEEKVLVGKKKLTFTNLSKIFWPQENYTKGDLLSYYKEIAPILLPYLKDRPQSLLRYPNGIGGKSFYQKDATRLDANWIQTMSIYSASNKKHIQYLLCQDEATLLYMVNLGCIDFNPWSSRKDSLEYPDYLLIDLDPEETDFSAVVKTALACREVLEKFSIPSFPKTSGAKGIHIYVPLDAKYTYEQSRQLAQLLCIQVNKKIPTITSLKRNPKERKGLVYLDYLQNIAGQTLASVYSVRAYPGATVSTPLQWSEVTEKLHPSQFTLKNISHRIQKEGDLFKGILGKGIDMKKIVEKMSI